MGHSQVPTTREVVWACRIAQEAAELGEDAVAWRKHLMDRLQRRFLFGGGVGMATVMTFPMTPTAMGVRLLVYGDAADPAVIAGMNDYFSAADVSSDPETPAFVGMGPRSFVRTREQVVDDATWYGCGYYNDLRRPVGQDDTLYSQVMIPELGCCSGIGFTRPNGSPRFTRRHAAIVHLAHRQIGHLWRRGRSAAAVKLGPRLWQVLDCLCRGLGEKEVARELSLRPTTVHNYVGALHRRLGVSSRGELVRAGLALRRRRGPAVLPAA